MLVNGWTIVDGWRIAARRETYIHRCHIKSNGDGPPARHRTLALTLGGNHHASLTIVRLERYSESSNDGQSLSLLGFVPRRLRLATFHGLRQMLGNQRRQEGIPLGQLVEGGFSAADGAGYLIRRGAGGLRQAWQTKGVAAGQCRRHVQEAQANRALQVLLGDRAIRVVGCVAVLRHGWRWRCISHGGSGRRRLR